MTLFMIPALIIFYLPGGPLLQFGTQPEPEQIRRLRFDEVRARYTPDLTQAEEDSEQVAAAYDNPSLLCTSPMQEDSYPRYLLKQTREVISSPLHWDHRERWRGAGFLAGLALAGALDHSAADYVHHSSTDAETSAATNIGKLGAEYSFAVIGGFWLSGHVFQSDRARSVARDCFTSSIIASGLITPLLKQVAGRQRPNVANDPDSFRLFSGNQSFPSGHTTQAFAIAGTIANHYPQRWVKYTSFGVASLVGLSRMETEAHYLTDVVMGAYVGIYVSNQVSGNHERRYKFSWEPYVSNEGVGLSLKFPIR